MAIADAPTKGPKFGVLTFEDRVEFTIHRNIFFLQTTMCVMC